MPGRKSRVRAGIELAGHTLRYAEVEAWSSNFDTGLPGPPPGLVRMGACDFDFDVSEALLFSDDSDRIETIGRALADIYRGSTAEQLCIAVHPWQSTSFFSPLPADVGAADKFDQLRQETGLLADIPPPRPLHLAVTPVRTETRPDGAPYYWHHVLHLPEEAHARAAELGRRLGAAVTHRFADAAGAVAAVAARRWPFDASPDEHSERTFTLALGSYGSHVEASLLKGDNWYFGHSFEAPDGADAAYFTAVVLDHLGIEPAAVKRLAAYGEAGADAALDAVEKLLDLEAVPLNPLPIFRSVRSEADPASLAAFAPAVGAALR